MISTTLSKFSIYHLIDMRLPRIRGRYDKALFSMSKWHRYLNFHSVSDIRILVAKYKIDNYLQLSCISAKISDRCYDFISKHNQKSFNTRKESPSQHE